MLRGQWPVRDFVEPGFPLQTWLAYAGLRSGGYQLSWEGFIACAFIAISAALTYTLCRRLGVPRWLSLLVVVIAVATFPRLYTYPKAFVYPAAIWALLCYQHRPDRRSLLLVALATAIAFLFRHDHGVWIVAPTVIGFAYCHWREPKVACADHRRLWHREPGAGLAVAHLGRSLRTRRPILELPG